VNFAWKKVNAPFLSGFIVFEKSLRTITLGIINIKMQLNVELEGDDD
jgi:hypothetical protein